jgi:hypothetical protein
LGLHQAEPTSQTTGTITTTSKEATMKVTSTIQDVKDHRYELASIAKALATINRVTEEDWFHSVSIGNMEFDLNIFDTDHGTRIVDAYPVIQSEDSSYSDSSNFITLITVRIGDYNG